jgi:hypothetical protein
MKVKKRVTKSATTKKPARKKPASKAARASKFYTFGRDGTITILDQQLCAKITKRKLAKQRVCFWVKRYPPPVGGAKGGTYTYGGKENPNAMCPCPPNSPC